MAHEVIILGVFVVDAAFRTARMPEVGETVLGSSFALGPGGKGSNQATAAAKAGADVGFIARIGDDTFAQIGRDLWASVGITPLVEVDGALGTGAAGIFIEEEQGRNSIIISPGAAGATSVADIEARRTEIAGAKVAVTQLEQPMPAAERFLQIASAAGVTTVFNPAPAAPLPVGLLALCDFVTPNEEEAKMLTGIDVRGLEDARVAARALLDQGVRKAAIVTLGENGAFVDDGNTPRHIPPMSAGAALDTTGAGDAFNGGFATALAKGLGLDEALRFATATAALSVTRHGTAASMPEWTEILRVLDAD